MSYILIKIKVKIKYSEHYAILPLFEEEIDVIIFTCCNMYHSIVDFDNVSLQLKHVNV